MERQRNSGSALPHCDAAPAFRFAPCGLQERLHEDLPEDRFLAPQLGWSVAKSALSVPHASRVTSWRARSTSWW